MATNIAPTEVVIRRGNLVDYVAPLAFPVTTDGYEVATHTLRWYNHTTRDWVVSLADDLHRQVGPSEYVYSRGEAIDLVMDLLDKASTPECCRRASNNGGPMHNASPRCESGKRAHCSCDTCF